MLGGFNKTLQKYITVISQEDFAGAAIWDFRKSSFVSVPLKLMVLHKLNNQPLTAFYDYLYYFIEVKEVDIIVRDFSFDRCRKARLPQMLSEYVQQTSQEFPIHILGSTLDHVYVKELFLEDYEVEIVVWNTYFPVRVKTSKKDIDFIVSWIKMKKIAVHLNYFYIYFWLCTHLKNGFNNLDKICKYKHW